MIPQWFKNMLYQSYWLPVRHKIVGHPGVWLYDPIPCERPDCCWGRWMEDDERQPVKRPWLHKVLP